MVWCRKTKFGMVTQVGRNVFAGVSHALIPRGRCPSAPKFLWPTCAHTAWETVTKFCMFIKRDVRKIFTGSSTTTAKIFGDTTADARPAYCSYPCCLSRVRMPTCDTDTNFCLSVCLSVCLFVTFYTVSNDQLYTVCLNAPFIFLNNCVKNEPI